MVFLNGPWNIAVKIRRAELILKDAREDPSFFTALMDFTTQVSLTFGEAVLPLKARICYSDCLASSSYISHELYRRLVLPYHKQITTHFKKKSTGVGLHICGYATPILNDMVESGADFISIDSPTDLAKAMEITRGRTVLMGNINPNLFSYGSRENLREAIENSIKNAGSNGGYILASGCEIPSSATPDRVSWFMELAEELG